VSLKRDVRRERRSDRRAVRRARRAVLVRRWRCFWSWPFGHVYDPMFCVGCFKPKSQPGQWPPKPQDRDATRA